MRPRSTGTVEGKYCANSYWLNRDPAGLSGGINLYAYVGNNPVNAVDPLGLWSSINWPAAGFQPVHQIAIDHALSFLPAADRAILKAQQPIADQDQSPADQYTHAMRDGTANQSVADAERMANNYVHARLNEARSDECAGKHEDAMRELGLAIHTLQDSTSPSHIGFQPWGGPGSQSSLAHVMAERTYPGDNSSLFGITQQAYNYFSGAAPTPANFFQ